VSSFFNRPAGEQFLEENTNGKKDIIEEQFRDHAKLNNKEKNKKKLTKTRMSNNGQRNAKMDRYMIENSLFEHILLIDIFILFNINT
jgi:hypothetical protein